jgi:hypothetical protein
MCGRVQTRHPVQIVIWLAKHTFWADYAPSGSWRAGSPNMQRETGTSQKGNDNQSRTAYWSRVGEVVFDNYTAFHNELDALKFGDVAQRVA